MHGYRRPCYQSRVPTGHESHTAEQQADTRLRATVPAFAPDASAPPTTATRGHTPRRLSGFAPDYCIGGSTPAYRDRTLDGTPVQLASDYAGSLTRDGMTQDATRIRATVQPTSEGFAVDDTLITRNGIAHYVRSRSPNVVRYPDGDVSIGATIEVAQIQRRIRQSTERRS